MPTCRALLLLLLCLPFLPAARAQSASAHGAPANSASACASCHRAESMSQPLTDMGRALQLPPHDADLNAHPDLTFTRGPYRYTVKTSGGVTQYSVSDGTRTITVPVLWAMGAKAQTWVLDHDGQMYESLVSWYPDTHALDVTVGDDILHPATLEQAIGRPLDKEGVSTCFGCHATHAVIDHKLNLSHFQPGLGCAHCHVGVEAHLAAVVHGDMNVTPPDLSNLSSEDMSSFCGTCHRSFSLVVRQGWRGVADVRFQPYRLALSKCFNGADPRIACIACHNPHGEVSHDAAFYDKKCLACHSPAMAAHAINASHEVTAADAAPTSPVPPTHAKVCPVATTRCVSCHMPKTKFPGGHFTFTDHYIRVVKPGEPYPY
jgi:hypothetical protein